LQELVPEYIQQVPADPFNNFSPINYKPGENEALIYSFGPDRKDQQGMTEVSRNILDGSKGQAYTAPPGDIVFRLED